MEAGKRLKTVRNYFCYTQKELAEFLGVTTRSVQNYEKSRYLRPEVVEKISREFNVNPVWLMTAVGEMFDKEDGGVIKSINSGKKASKIITIPKVEENQDAGDKVNEYGNNESSEKLRMETSILPYSSKKMKMIEIVDDSMEPTFKKNDIVIFEVTNYEDDGVYAIHKDGKYIVRRVQKDLSDNQLLIICDNKSYSSFKIDQNDSAVEIVGSVIYLLTKFS